MCVCVTTIIIIIVQVCSMVDHVMSCLMLVQADLCIVLLCIYMYYTIMQSVLCAFAINFCACISIGGYF